VDVAEWLIATSNVTASNVTQVFSNTSWDVRRQQVNSLKLKEYCSENRSAFAECIGKSTVARF